MLIPARLAQGLLGNASATLYTAPSLTVGSAGGVTALITSIWFANTDASDHTITLYFVESGGSIGDNRAVMKAVTIKANRTYILSCDDPMASGDTIRGLADAADKVAYKINGGTFLHS